MAKRSCYDCVYSWFDPERWLRDLWAGRTLVPMCANHPQWPGQLREVPGVPCCNFRPKHVEPEGDVKRIPLSGGHYALVDAADYEWLNQYNWRLHTGYAMRQEKGKRVYMHREIMQAAEGTLIDHANCDKLDNRRVNLRTCTRDENMRNKGKHMRSASRFKGVGYSKSHHKWYALLRFEGMRFWLGYFDDETEAAHAYDRKAVEIFGEFAHLNFPEEWPAQRRAQVRAEAKVQAKEEKAEERRRKPRRKDGKSSTTAPTRGRRTRTKSNRTQPARAKGRRTHRP